MSTQSLLLVETSGIQDYIFGSNQLAQNIGASELVAQATSKWVVEVLNDGEFNHNARWNSRKYDVELDMTKDAQDGLEVRVIFTGGGNALILFSDDDSAQKFTQALSKKALFEAPGLQLVIKRRKFDPQQDALSVCHRELIRELAQRKLDRKPSVPLLGLGVTAECAYTGKPAVGVDTETPGERKPLISSEVKAKLKARKKGHERLKIHAPLPEKFDFVYNFDHFGTKGESTYLAVIHTDGNGMGKRIKKIGDKYLNNEKNADYITALRAFSNSVKQAATNALRNTVKMLFDNLSDEEAPNDRKIADLVPVPYFKREEDDEPKWHLPFRPIVFGGDDVTFVCEGRLGLAIATKYLAEYSNQQLADEEKAHARAGIAVVKSHYPFSRAYELADALCASAKHFIKDKSKNGYDLTALDWHFAVTGLVRPLDEVRSREYTINQRDKLYMRPLLMNDIEKEWRTWSTFKRIVDDFQKPAVKKGEWAGRRNKIKALREALRGGREEVKRFLRIYGGTLPQIETQKEMAKEGWESDRCGYFDAIEALDFYLPLKGGEL